MGCARTRKLDPHTWNFCIGFGIIIVCIFVSRLEIRASTSLFEDADAGAGQLCGPQPCNTHTRREVRDARRGRYGIAALMEFGVAR